MEKQDWGDIFDPGEVWFWAFWLTLPIHGIISVPALIIWGIVSLF
jgi:uncharacterized membrane protein SpoIIM required for sporulation